MEIIEYVKAHPRTFQSDLEAAIRYSIFHELVKYKDMNDEQISALRGYISVLNKYDGNFNFKLSCRRSSTRFLFFLDQIPQSNICSTVSIYTFIPSFKSHNEHVTAVCTTSAKNEENTRSSIV